MFSSGSMLSIFKLNLKLFNAVGVSRRSQTRRWVKQNIKMKYMGVQTVQYNFLYNHVSVTWESVKAHSYKHDSHTLCVKQSMTI